MKRPGRPSREQFQRWGVDRDWSRMVQVADRTGTVNTWHVLDRRPPVAPIATIVCVHGNPTWSYYWRSFHERLGGRYRVVAIDQLGMGYSDRTGLRRYAQRVDDLADIIDALGIDGPIVLAAHDWGGAVALGWAVTHADRVQGMVLCNTGIAVPTGRRAPALIRLAASGPITDLVGHRTRIFIDGTLALSGRRVGKSARDAYRAPYRHAEDRPAIAEFVADVPFRPSDPSAADIAAVADRVHELTMPVLLAWGSRDPVFNDDFALDLAARLPQADIHRFPKAGHLVVEEVDVAGVVEGWLDDRLQSASPAGDGAVTPVPSVPPLWSGLAARRGDVAAGFVDGSSGVTTSFAALHDRVMGIAAGLAAHGVRPGDRVALLVPPGVDLLAAAYACWRAGAITVIADRGLGLRGLGTAVRGAHVQWVVGPPKSLAAATVLRWAPGARRIAVGTRRVFGAVATLDELAVSESRLPDEPSADDVAAVLYTSGATGPAKGVRYRHGQMTAQRDALASLYGITAGDRLVAAFAPFALYGPALGIASTIPDVDVTAPGTLTAAALASAVASIEATIVFASPAALANVNRTAVGPDRRMVGVRLVLSAGAPVPVATLRATAVLCSAAELHTPYGMTECLPVADIDLTAVEMIGAGHGVCVGVAVPGVDVMIASADGDAHEPVTPLAVGTTGEVLVRAAWLSDGYDRLWSTQHLARPTDALGGVWHRTGDVGHVDDDGRLWIEGRTVHVIQAEVAITPVPVEVAVERLDGVERAAAVGVGPRGVQQLVVVVEDATAPPGLAGDALASSVRDAVDVPVAAVLTVRALPVDIRHNTKIDRSAVASWAAVVLAGGSARPAW